MNEEERKKIWADFMSDTSSRWEELGIITKDELREVVDAIDDWITVATPSFLAAIPSPGATALTGKQKILLFNAAIAKRWEVS